VASEKLRQDVESFRKGSVASVSEEKSEAQLRNRIV